MKKLLPVDLFDRLLDVFSAADLKGRVCGIMIAGLATCMAVVIGGYIFLNNTYTISITGTGAWSAQTPPVLEVALDRDDMERLSPKGDFLAEVTCPGKMPFRTDVTVLSIDPGRGVIYLGASGIPDEFLRPGRFDVRIILFEKPFWKLLWGT